VYTHSLRLHPHQDLLLELDQWAAAHDVEAACVVTCVGSLRRAVLRYANQPDGTLLEEKYEILALSGTLSKHGSHLHIALSDGQGQTVGGHLLAGCHIYTTAEIVLAVLPNQRFLRLPDQATGYEELYIIRD
jgi:predicted DNA-binding protein with PD1-like motif